MKAFLRASAILFALVIGAASATAQTKLGFVDTEKILTQMTEFKDIQSQIETMRKSYADTLGAIEKNFNARVETYQKQQAMMTAEAKEKEEAALKSMEAQYQQYYQDRLGPQGVLAQAQNRLMQPIKDKVKGAIEKVARDEKLSAVMEDQLLIYFDNKLDITFKVLDYLKRGN
jgi:outer membrane protein